MTPPEDTPITIPNNSSCSVTIDGREMLLIHRHGEHYLYNNRCPHTEETLDPMGGSIVSEDGLLFTCQRHGAEFVADTGECVGGPCQGERMEPVAFTLSGGQIYLD